MTTPNTTPSKTSAMDTTMTVVTSAPVLSALSVFMFVTGFIWFIIELIIVSLNQGSFTDYSVIEPLSAQTLQLFMYSMILAAFSYGASWYAHTQRTRAARQLAVFASVFTVFAWMWELYFIIPTFRKTSDASNIYCNNVATRFCHISQTAGSMSVILEFALVLNAVWAAFVAVTSVQPDHTLVNDNAAYSTEVINADDLEILRVCVNKQNVYDQIRQRIRALSWANYVTNAVTLIGWIILTLSTIQISKDIGIAAFSNELGFTQRLGDPIIASLWFPLTLTLGLSIGAAAYSSSRMNRSVTASAMFLAVMTTLQWWSFFIYSGRRFQQDNATFGLSSLIDEPAQRSMVSGAGIIVCAETIKVVILVFRYFTYVPVTRADQNALRVQSQHDAPTVIINDMDDATKPYRPENTMDNTDASTALPYYNQPMFAGTTFAFQGLFYVQLIALLTFWGNEFVFAADKGLFTGTPNTNPPYSPEQSFYFSQIQFIYQTVLLLAVWFASFHAERKMSVSSSTAALFITTISVAGWFLLIWPTAYQALPNKVGDISSACTQGSGDWCRLTGSASVLSFITLFLLSALWINSVIGFVSSYTQSVAFKQTTQIVPTLIAIVMLSGLAIWGLTTIKLGVQNVDFLAQQQEQSPALNGVSLEESYWASQVFLILTILSFASWIGISATLSYESWQSWSSRLNSWIWSNILVAILLPFFVLTTRFIQSDALNSVHLSVASGIIILFAGALFYHMTILTMCFEDYYPITLTTPRKEVVLEMNADPKAIPMPTAVTTTEVIATPNPGYTTVPVAEQQV